MPFEPFGWSQEKETLPQTRNYARQDWHFAVDLRPTAVRAVPVGRSEGGLMSLPCAVKELELSYHKRYMRCVYIYIYVYWIIGLPQNGNLT